jgi:hypothetical protein
MRSPWATGVCGTGVLFRTQATAKMRGTARFSYVGPKLSFWYPLTVQQYNVDSLLVNEGQTA